MNDELQKQIAELLAALLANAKDGAAWVKGEIPLLVAEKVRFGIAEAALWIVAGFGLWVIAWRAYSYGKERQWDDYEHASVVPAGFLCAFATVIGALAVSVNARALLLAWLAPRLYIIEWLSSLAR